MSGAVFSGDKTQLVPLIKGALSHKGTAILDVISPCVAFNNHVGSTKSFDYVREHNEAVNRMDVITPRAPITADYKPGETEGSPPARRLDPAPAQARGRLRSERSQRRARLPRAESRGGRDRDRPAVTSIRTRTICTMALAPWTSPLNKLTDADLIPPVSALEKINAALR